MVMAQGALATASGPNEELYGKRIAQAESFFDLFPVLGCLFLQLVQDFLALLESLICLEPLLSEGASRSAAKKELPLEETGQQAGKGLGDQSMDKPTLRSGIKKILEISLNLKSHASWSLSVILI